MRPKPINPGLAVLAIVAMAIIVGALCAFGYLAVAAWIDDDSSGPSTGTPTAPEPAEPAVCRAMGDPACGPFDQAYVDDCVTHFSSTGADRLQFCRAAAQGAWARAHRS